MSELLQPLRQAQRVHLSGYQARDYEVIDYHMYELPGTGLSFRGPPPALDGDYFACIGAAQTFGCFCESPYPSLLAERLGMPALNLGYGGAGPEFYASHEALLSYLNSARFVVVQVMSGRSQSNSMFHAGGLEYLTRRADGRRLSSDRAYRELLEGNQLWRRFPLPRVGRKVGKLLALPRAHRVVNETRHAWIESYRSLLTRITVPKVLLWFSKRQPEYQERYASVSTLFGEFPHLVNARMVREVRELCDHYCECVSSRGSPQPLRSRFTGLPTTVNPADDRPDLAEARPWSHNRYYPSPEMHVDAADALEPVCRHLIGGSVK